jgi:hypothetical protein
VHAEDLTLCAEVGIAAVTADASAARDDGVHDHPTAEQSTVNVGGGRHDAAAELMAHHQRWRAAWAVMLE